MLKLKCCKCPYRLGKIKCEINPCLQCKSSKCKKPPFPEAEIKEETICKSKKL